MKRINNSQQERSVLYCRAYKEDIQQVIDLMTQDGQPPKLISGDFEFADADELFSFLGEKGKAEIDIRRSNPSVTVSASPYSDEVRVHTYGNSDASVALVHRVGEVLGRCEGRKPVRSHISFFMIGVILFWGSLDIAWYLRNTSFVLLFSGLSIIGMAIAGLGFTYRAGKANKFYGVSRDSRRSFFQRKGDDLLVGLISGVVGAAIGALLGIAGTLFAQAHATSNTPDSAAQSSPRASATHSDSH